MWVEAGAQPDLEQKLDIGGFGYPAMAVLNSKKLKFSLLRGSFSEEGINEFLRCRAKSLDLKKIFLKHVTNVKNIFFPQGLELWSRPNS